MLPPFTGLTRRVRNKFFKRNEPCEFSCEPRTPFVVPFLIFWLLAIITSFCPLGGIPAKVISNLFIRTISLLILLFLLVGFGQRILGLLRIRIDSKSDEFVYGCGLGLGTLAYIVLGLGLLGLLYRWMAYLLLFGILLFSYRQISELGLLLRRKLSSYKWNFSAYDLVLSVILITTAIFIFIGGLVPSYTYDDLVYHLAVPKLYISNHRISYIPYNHYSNFPFLMEMLYTLGLLIGDDSTSRLFHFITFMLTALSVYSFARRRFGHKTALLAGTIFFNIPLAGQVSTWAHNDIGASLFATLSVLSIINWFCARERKWLILSAITCGLAMGVKYPQILFSFCPLLVIITGSSLIERMRKKIAIRNVLIFTAIALAVFSPWLIKNFAFTGNPVYPFFYNYLGGKGWSQFNSQKFFQEGMPQSFELTKIFKSPWEMSSPLTGIGPVFIFLLPFSFLMRGVGKEIKLLGAYSSLYFILWTVLSQNLRFLIPSLGCLSLIVAYTAFSLDHKPHRESLMTGNKSQMTRRWLGGLIRFGVFSLLLMNLVSFIPFVVLMDPFRVALRLESREKYLSEKLYYYGAIKFINKELPQDSLVLFIGEARTFYCEKRFLSNTALDTNIIVELTDASSSADELRENLRERGVTHILINELEVARLEKNYSCFKWFKKESPFIYKEFCRKYLREIFSQPGHDRRYQIVLYELVGHRFSQMHTGKKGFKNL